MQRRATRGALVIAALFVALAAAPASANAPEIDRFSDSGSFADTGLCGFRLHVEWSQTSRSSQWSDHGDLTRYAAHGIFFETIRANGKVATGTDRTNIVDSRQGYDVFTGAWIFGLPDGSTIRNVGRSVISYETGEELFRAGPHQIDDSRFADRFCSAMA